MKILIAVDGSIYTDHALEFLASREGFLAGSPEIEMLSVVPQIPAGALRFIERETLEGYYKDCSEKIFKPIRKFLKGKDLPVEEVYVSAIRPRVSPTKSIAPNLTSWSWGRAAARASRGFSSAPSRAACSPAPRCRC